jgi:hypothetical protein
VIPIVEQDLQCKKWVGWTIVIMIDLMTIVNIDKRMALCQWITILSTFRFVSVCEYSPDRVWESLFDDGC